ncbi:MAG: glutamyl-tRNA reductase [Williamsia sp.]|nr:glutamyl-tRNA reductase [Williamsia sp.]
MQTHNYSGTTGLRMAGINYKKTDATVRGQYAVSAEQYASLLAKAPAAGISELFVLSTCNRTEIYGIVEDVSQLTSLLCSETAGNLDTFSKLSYTKKGHAAVEHLFQVAAGLDSQILGDYEIVGQIKQAVKFSKERGFIGSFLDRLVNCVLQSSKGIKNQTALSGGTVSVSFAAVQYIKQRVSQFADKKILLLGTGKIGRSTCKNLVDYLGTSRITLINRTAEKADKLAMELGLHSAPIEQLSAEIEQSDIILVATNAAQPSVLTTHLENKGRKLIIDLSIPYNVDPAAKELPNIELVNVDELSRLKDDTIKKRAAEVPKAKAIIAEHMQEFTDWNEHRKCVPVLIAVKSKLQEIHAGEMNGFHSLLPVRYSVTESNDRIQKVINMMALKMRRHNSRGCQYIEAINDFMNMGAN